MTFKLKTVLLLVLFQCITLYSRAQWNIEARTAKGFILSHRSSMEGLIKDHTEQYTLSFQQKTTGSKDWHYFYLMPTVGIRIDYISNGNSKELGNGIAITPSIQLPLGKKENSLLQTQIGVGIGYLSKTFSKTDNRKNIAIGSHINASVQFALLLQKRYKWGGWKTGLQFQHFSNASFATPNLGLNIPSLFAGCWLQIKKVKHANYSFPEIIMGQAKPANFTRLLATVGTKQYGSPDGARYLITQNSIEKGKRISPKFSRIFFADASFNQAQKKVSKTDGFQLGAGAGFLNHYGNFAFGFKLGAYLYSKHSVDGRLYQKLSVNYSISNTITVLASMRTHRAAADYLAFGLAFNI
jgi:hypothetical protein